MYRAREIKQCRREDKGKSNAISIGHAGVHTRGGPVVRPEVELERDLLQVEP